MEKLKNLLCIYRPPNSNLLNFTDQLNNIIKAINPDKCNLLLIRDTNIDFMKVNCHCQTEEYLDMLFSYRFCLVFLPIITKPTSITSYTANSYLPYLHQFVSYCRPANPSEFKIWRWTARKYGDSVKKREIL